MVVDRSLSSRLVGLAVHAVIAVVLITTIFPVLNILSNSVSETYHIIAGHVSFFPRRGSRSRTTRSCSWIR